ncbi:MAG: S8 family serine peptidase [bacterium]
MKFRFIFLLLLTPISFTFSQISFFIKIKKPVDINLSVISNSINQINISYNTYNKSSNYIILKPLSYSNIENDLGIFLITCSDSITKESFINEVFSKGVLEYSQDINTYKTDSFSNDSLLSMQWGLEKTNTFESWKYSRGDPNLIIGIIDTGIEDTHPDLTNQIYVNYGEMGLDTNGLEKRNNAVDDDNNGFIDDFRGWDFTDREGFPIDPTFGDNLGWDNFPADESGHGTGVAGIIGAEFNNLYGITGIAPNCQLLNLRAFDKNGEGEEDDVAAAILYAIDIGVKVINMSFGDDSYSQVLKDVIDYGYTKGVIFIGSAGNTSSQLPHYPSSYPGVISVGATTQNDFLASFSNYGSTIDLVAPGVEIMTTDLSESYKPISGTSASAPFVTSAAALLLSKNLALKNDEIKQILKTTCDDIESPGWDIKSGAGRLNIAQALGIGAPSVVDFISPIQDFATDNSSIDIVATILSPLFKGYSLYYGIGLNPDGWNTLISNYPYQVSNEKIYTLYVNNLVDTSYTLRLSLQLTSGQTLEERVNFYIDHTAANSYLINLGTAFYGETSTIFASIFTNEKSVVNLFYRKKGMSDFNKISLDGFTINNKFFSQQHFGFVPKYIIQSDVTYEVFFQVVNQAGLISSIKDNDSFFEVTTYSNFTSAPYNKLMYSLSPGRIYPEAVEISSQSMNQIFANYSNDNGYYSFLFTLNGNDFIKIDSLINRRPKSIGDFNNNGRIELLNLYSRNGYIDEQNDSVSSKFTNTYSDTTGNFWPAYAGDIDGDGFTEIISINKDDRILDVREMNQNSELVLESQLSNFSTSDDSGIFGSQNVFGQPNLIIDKIGGTNKEKIWTVDREGDIISFNIDGIDTYSNGEVLKTYFSGENGLITSGDYDGNGEKEIGVLLKSTDELNIAPFNLLIVFNFLGDSLNIIYSTAFIDPSASFLPQQFAKGGSCIRFADIDYDGTDELIVLAFPYTYIIKRVNADNVVIHYDENTNWELNESYKSIFIGDLNQNGISEIALPKIDKIFFYEFANINKPNAPSNLSGYSIDSTTIFLAWNGDSPQYFIYRQDKNGSSILYDSTNSNKYIDTVYETNEWYYYSIAASDNSFENHLSVQSKTMPIYAHKPAHAVDVKNVGNKNIQITFSEKIRKSVENIEAFKLSTGDVPRTVLAASEYSYLLNFDTDFENGNSQLIIDGLKDYYNSPIQRDTLYFTVMITPAEKEFFISYFEIVNPYKVKIAFNLDLDPTSFQDKENYSFNPENKVKVTEFDSDDPKVICLTLENPVGSIGKEYILNIFDVYSSDISGKILVNNGAGSVIVLSSHSKNLADIFVYPNPVNCSLQDKITFANLTKYAEIIIFTINGKKIKTLSENDGNGGTDWDLRDEFGNMIGSGIYLYRVTSFDEDGNKLEEIIKKLAVIK